MRSDTMVLEDGRTLSWAELGSTSRSDPVVVHHHGSASSRLEMAIYDDALAALGVRVIAPDRPGYGRSSPVLAAPTVATVAGDAVALLDRLDIAGCAVSGYSIGGGYALAMAASDGLAPRISRVLLRASLAPGLAPRHDDEAAWREHAALLTWPEFATWYTGADTADSFSPADQLAFSDPAYLEATRATLAEGAAQGTAGDAGDHWATATSWGFDLLAVTQPVDVWHGEADRAVPPAHARALAALLPTATLRLLPDEGHYSIGRYALEQLAPLVR